MLLILIIKNLFFFLKNCISIINLIKKKNLYYLILFVSIHFFILQSTAYCETIDIEKTESELLAEERKRSKLVSNICLIIIGLGFLLLWLDFLGFMFDEDDSDFYDSDSSSDELPEVKLPRSTYKQGPGYHFFVKDIGIRYDEDLDKMCPKYDFNNPADREAFKKVEELIKDLSQKSKK